jgi:hypothetical protein
MKTPIDNYRELARILADAVESHPHVIGRTEEFTARRADGTLTTFSDPEAVVFCAIGCINRTVLTGTATEHAANELEQEMHDLVPTGDLGGWFEGYCDDEQEGPANNEPPIDEYIRMLRAIAAGQSYTESLKESV